MPNRKSVPTLNEKATLELVKWSKQTRQRSENAFDIAQIITKQLGTHIIDDLVKFGFWAPQLHKHNIRLENVFLEILVPDQEFDLLAEQQQVMFSRYRIPVMQDDVYIWAVVEGMHAGTRDVIGVFYWLTYQKSDGSWDYITDYLANSVPYGVFAPSELYDIEGLQHRRKDKSYFQNLDLAPDPDGIQRVQEPVNILQIHPGTASGEATLGGLSRIYQTIAKKLRSNTPLTPAEKNYIGYDAIQLMPIEPPIEHEGSLQFWETIADAPDEDQVTVKLKKHKVINWGYDVMIAASPAPNPTLLGSGRPDELMDLIETLHNFPNKPIKVIFDIVYGHTDNQAVPLLPEEFLAGSNMYGQNLNYMHPVTRALLLEMQRRKHNYGVDGIRVDGAQDFKWWDESTDTMVHDDNYLRLMNDIILDVAGIQYRPWMIFEDGRPWPREDWEIASSYREVTKQMPNVWQWGPLTFAHNTPFIFTFWVNKWWRIREIAEMGRHWITGCANHDTLRRGTQVPIDARINTHLGNTLPQIIRNGYDNPATKLFDYAMMPGVPMDFINASMRAPWGFIRNTDDTYGVKVVSEEARFSQWLMTEERYAQDDLFLRLKQYGFKTLAGLRDFMFALDHAVQATKYDLEAIARIMNSRWIPDIDGPELTVKILKDIALAWMDDVYEFCNISHFQDEVEPTRADFNLKVREFRRKHTWLIENLSDNDEFSYLHPTDGTVLFYGKRHSPDERVQTLFIANMEGKPLTLIPNQLPLTNIGTADWSVALKTPELSVNGVNKSITLKDSQGVVFIRSQ